MNSPTSRPGYLGSSARPITQGVLYFRQTHPDVVYLKEMLFALGLLTDRTAFDRPERLGPITRTAVIAFQTIFGIAPADASEPDGENYPRGLPVCGSQTLACLNALRTGNSERLTMSAVGAIQRVLPLQRTGRYGPTTRKAVAMFNRGNMLGLDGNFSVASFYAMFVSPRRPPTHTGAATAALPASESEATSYFATQGPSSFNKGSRGWHNADAKANCGPSSLAMCFAAVKGQPLLKLTQTFYKNATNPEPLIDLLRADSGDNGGTMSSAAIAKAAKAVKLNAVAFKSAGEIAGHVAAGRPVVLYGNTGRVTPKGTWWHDVVTPLGGTYHARGSVWHFIAVLGWKGGPKPYVVGDPCYDNGPIAVSDEELLMFTGKVVDGGQSFLAISLAAPADVGAH